MLGKLLNKRFKILNALGSGGMGRVYKAVQVPLDRPVAVKILDPAYSDGKDMGFRKRFLLEASLTAQLRHPNTVTIFDYGRSEEGIYFIAMEYLEGRTLSEVLAAEGPLNWERVFDITRQVCRSLREAHKLGLVHRDLKPANVMLLNEANEGEEVVKVLDFGLVKPFLPDAPGQELEVTEAGVLLGSPLYMAPEQAKNQSDPRSDVYSLGILMYQMLAGKTPFSGKQAIDVIVKHMRERPTPLQQIRNTIPPEVSALVLRCLEKDPVRRFQSMQELMDAMRRVATSLGLNAFVTAPQTGLSQSMVTGRFNVRSAEQALPLPTPSRGKAIALFALAGVIGLGSFYLGSRALRANSASQLGASTPQVPVSEGTVTFVVNSYPQAARVEMHGRIIGTTPFELESTANADGVATVELTFIKEGYGSETVRATGNGPKVRIFQRLNRSQ